MENLMDKDVHTIGEILKNARVSQKKDLDTVSEELYIRKHYLSAIEEMDLENIPPMPYCIGFVRSYAKYLGLNSDRIVNSYKQFLSGEEPEEEEPLSVEEISETSSPRLKHILFGVLGLAVLLIAWSVLPISEDVEEYKEDNTSIVTEPIIVEEDADEDNIDEEDLIEEIEEDEVPLEEVKKEEKKETRAQKTSSGLQFVLSGSSWIELKNGSRTLINGIRPKGYKYEIPNEKGLTITVGKPQFVQFYFEGKPVKVITLNQRKNVSLDKFIKE